MTTLRNALCAGRTVWLLRGLIWTVAFSLAWLQVSPSYAAAHAAVRENARRAAWLRAHTPHVNLPAGLTQTPDAALRAKIDAKQAAAPVADARSLSGKEMRAAHGRGLLRNPYFSGTLPWQRSLRDVNICTGNLFKSFTDMQIASGRGAGLVLQRTYNSNDARIGPFGVGWTQAYDIRIQEAPDVRTQSGNASVDSSADDVPRTDFFGAKHTYHRDADGLYSPPSYMFDETNSDYDSVLANGPTKVMADTEKGEDGTIKHYVNVVTLADGTEGNERACDSIQDRHGNTTNLTYGQTISQPGGSTRKLLTQVTDPSGRSLAFTWTNLGTAAQPAYRITQVQGPLVGGAAVPGVTYQITYAYYTDPNEANAANDLFNLKSVTLDAGGLSRTTTYTYTGCSYTYTDGNGQPQTATENGLLASISDPLGHAVSYTYGYPGRTNSLWVATITEPAGVDAGGSPRTNVWAINSMSDEVDISENEIFSHADMEIEVDNSLRVMAVSPEDEDLGVGWSGTDYDASNNVASKRFASPAYSREDAYTYGAHGNVLTHTVLTGGVFPADTYNSSAFPGVETTTWYNASQYFQKATVSDMNGHTTAMGVGTSMDANTGNRGETLWVQDAGYNDPSSPSYHKQFTYTYNQYGQKTSETNLNGVVTTYTYGDQWGNLTQVVQDPGAGHLNRTTTMSYDAAGRVLQSTDPAGQTSTFLYNTLGQPLSIATPAKGSAPAETITYAYDTKGRTLSVKDNRGTTSMAYEAGCDRVHSVTDPVTGTTGYTYGLLGERLTMTLPGGGVWTYNYITNVPGSVQPTGEHPQVSSDDPDKMGPMLNSITDDQGRKVEYGFDERGVMHWSRSNEVYTTGGSLVAYCQTDYVYDHNSTQFGHGWLSQVKTTWNALESRYPTMGHQLISENDYTYDNAGQRLTNTVTQMATNPNGSAQFVGGAPQYDGNQNVTNQVTTTRVEKYQKADGSSGYDALNRLTNVDYGDGQTQSYSFDAMGNRLSRADSASGTTTSAYNAANMLLSTSGYGASGFQNDADGNTLSGNGRTNAWDSQNRLVSCIINGNTSTYKYGADGLRRQKTTSGASTDYAYDATMMVREGHAAGGSLTPSTVTATYLIGARGPEYRRDDTQSEVDSQGRTVTKARWYVYDGLGSVVGEVDPLGNLTSSPKYDVYGAVRANAGAASTRQGFVGGLGHVSDAEAGLIYMRARYYDPVMGRFISQDPSKKQFNWFIYCNDEPINHADPTGKDGELMGTIMSSDISATLDGIGSDFAVDLEGEVVNGARDGSTGQLNDWAQFFVKQLEDQAEAGSGDWGYYTKRIADGSGNSLKAWVRYNDELGLYDMYLNADEGACFEHAVPYAGTM